MASFHLFLFFVFFISLTFTAAQAGLSTASSYGRQLITLVVDETPLNAGSVSSLEPRRSHEYDDDDYTVGDDDDPSGYDDNEDDDDDTSRMNNESSESVQNGKHEWEEGKEEYSSVHTSTRTTWQADSSTAYITESGSSPSWSLPYAASPTPSNLAPPAPLATAQPSISPEKAALITSQAIKARQRAVDALPSIITTTWLSPQLGEAFATGDEIVLQWKSPSAAASHFRLRLCVLKSTADLDRAQSGAFSNGACGVAVEVDSSLALSGAGLQIAFGAPAVTAADSFFIVMSPSQALASPSVDLLHQRDSPPLSQLVSPAFVLAPQGIDLSTLNNLLSTPSPSATATEQPQQLQQQADTASKGRPVAWFWVVGPVLTVACILFLSALIYSHRRGQRSARDAALKEARQGEEKWREETRKEVDLLADSTIGHAARCSIIEPPRCPPPVMQGLASPKPGRCADSYGYIPSDLGRPLHRSSTMHSSSSSESSQSSPSLCALSIRHVTPYLEQKRCSQWTTSTFAPIEREEVPTTDSPMDNTPVLLPPPIPAALLPRSSANATLSNPHEASRRPTSFPTMSSPSPQARNRVFSFSAVEASNTTGKRGTAHDFIDKESMQRANQVNNLYMQLKEALQQSSVTRIPLVNHC